MMVCHNGKTDELNFKIVCDRELLLNWTISQARDIWTVPAAGKKKDFQRADPTV